MPQEFEAACERDRVELDLRNAVVEAALAQRRAQLAFDAAMRRALQNSWQGFDRADLPASDDAADALSHAVDALLAFHQEVDDAK